MAFSWTGPEPSAWVDVQAPAATNLILACEIAHAIHPDVLSGLLVRMNGQKLTTTHCPVTGGTRITATIPHTIQLATNSIAHLQFDIPQVYSPRDMWPNNTDSRLLGVAFRSIEVLADGLNKPEDLLLLDR